MFIKSAEQKKRKYLLVVLAPMYQSNRSFNIPLPGILRTFDAFSCPGGREFDRHSWGVGNLIASLYFILRVELIPRGFRGLISHGGDGGDVKL